ncbi:hypothetical protein FRC03_002415 [Tulasnella sp. 419]|nr:hypothetical protein FRC02_006410 [Tulasnella sp. 418]KAG8943623.1 hypothetical protein FRC03_002415 [Tulasnella sp. 419]
MDVDDELIATIPVHLSSQLSSNLHLHQFPLLNRPLQVPPSAASSGKRIRARYKPKVGRYEIQVPVDMRPEVWNPEKGKEYGAARYDEDKEELAATGLGQPVDKKPKKKKKGLAESDEEEIDTKNEKSKRLGELRLRSEQIANKGDYYVGILKNGELHLHPISQTHQFRPSLTYLDVLSRKAKPQVGDDEEEDEDEGNADKGKAPARDVQISARGSGEGAGGAAAMGGLSAVRREMIATMRKEQEEKWHDLDWYDEKTSQAEASFNALFSTSQQALHSKSHLGDTLKSIKGLSTTHR